jgi:hypothetical protein
MVPQREVSIAPFYIGAGALEHLRKRGRFSLQPVLRNRIQRIQRPTGHKQRGTEALPAWMAILVALLLLLNYRSHSDLLFPSFASGWMMAKDGEVAFWF